MRAHEIINESNVDIPLLATQIFRDCQPYLLSKSDDRELYRGVILDNGVTLVSVQKDRKPRDTTLFAHDLINQYFHKRFGIKFRSESVFATGNKGAVSPYGKACVIYPIGNFDYCWSSQIRDMTYNLITPYAFDSVLDTAEIRNRIIERLDNSDYRCNVSIDDFQRAVASHHEIMINCDAYYIVDRGENELRSELKRLRNAAGDTQ